MKKTINIRVWVNRDVLNPRQRPKFEHISELDTAQDFNYSLVSRAMRELYGIHASVEFSEIIV